VKKTSHQHQELHCLGSFLQTLLTINNTQQQTVLHSLLELRLLENHIQLSVTEYNS